MGYYLPIIFWALILAGLVYFVIRWAQTEASLTNQSSGLSSVETVSSTDDELTEEQAPRVPRISGSPVAFAPDPEAVQISRERRGQAEPEATHETPVYVGQNSSAVPVRSFTID